MRKEVETAVLEDLALSVDNWTRTLLTYLTDPTVDLAYVDDEAPYRRIQQILSELDQRGREDLKVAIFDALEGLMHSTLVTFDGGTNSAEIGRVFIVDEDGNEMEGNDWHSAFIGHLVDTGRKEAGESPFWRRHDGRVDPYADES